MSSTHWRVRAGDILDEPADVLICSANPFLTLSGGVGGALLLRYGPSLQVELNEFLKRQGRRYLEPGSIVVTEAAAMPYRAVVHAVAVNAFYESSPEIVGRVLRAALVAAAERGAITVAVTALATGYGKLSIAQFASGLNSLVCETFPPIREVVIGVRKVTEPAEINRVAPLIKVG